ncbi:MAG: hypothetical protein E6G46_04080 [Actinobacteria bacterium]|nr:MAG: hypothetical protein E6G46_04080 [Actinomycetota bacterium]
MCNSMVAYPLRLRNRAVALRMRAMHIEKHVVLAAAPDEAWAVVVDFASWFCHAADMGAIKPGARIQFSWEDGTTRAAVFEDVDVPRFLAFRWLPFARDEHGDPIPRPQARVEITLTAVDEGSEMHVVERRLDGALAGAIA